MGRRIAGESGRRSRRPDRQSPAGGALSDGCREAGRPATQIAFENFHLRRFDWDPAVLAPLPRTWMTAPSSLRRRSPTLARNSSSARRPASRAVRIRARSRSTQSLRHRGCGSVLSFARSAATEPAGRTFGSVFASLGRPTNCIGLAAISSDVYRNVTGHSTWTYTVESFRLHVFRRIARTPYASCRS